MEPRRMATTWLCRQGILQCRRVRGGTGRFYSENSAAVVLGAPIGTAPRVTTMGGDDYFGRTTTSTTTILMRTTRHSRKTIDTTTSAQPAIRCGVVVRKTRAGTTRVAVGRHSAGWLFWKNHATGSRPSREGNPFWVSSSVFRGGSHRHASTSSTRSTPTSATTAAGSDDSDSAHCLPVDDNESKDLDHGGEKAADLDDIDESNYRFMDHGQEEFDLEDDEDETGSEDEDEDDIVEEEVETGSFSSVKVETNLRQKNIAAGRRHLRRIQAGKESALEQQTAVDAADEDDDENADDEDDGGGCGIEKDEFGDNGPNADEGENADEDDQHAAYDDGNQFLSDPATDDNDDWKSDEEIVLELVSAEAPAKKEVKKRGKYNKAKHRGNFVFEAVPLFVDTIKNTSDTFTTEDVHEASSVARISLSSTTSLADRIVLVDNLPIDITVGELDRLYSRFGPLESVRIFNQRPDLDPGPLTKMQQKERLSRQIRSVGLHNCRWKRPCSPVHALLTYVESNAGALDEALCIFGMILHRHPARSIPATDLTRLYIENLPATLHNNDKPVTAIEVEHWLTQQLDPDHYLCLGAGQSYSSLVGSCELWFPNFEHAYQAFAKLERMDVFQDETNQCRVHWRRSPSNALKWWTREIGFN